MTNLAKIMLSTDHLFDLIKTSDLKVFIKNNDGFNKYGIKKKSLLKEV